MFRIFPLQPAYRGRNKVCDPCTDNHVDRTRTEDKNGQQRCASDSPMSFIWWVSSSIYTNRQDDSVKEYLRMREDHKKALKKIKQQIGMLCMRHGYYYEGTKWTISHMKWLRKLELAPMYQETLDEYLASYETQTAKIERFDVRIEEIASQAEYAEKVKKLVCFLGIKTHTAISLIVETGDFTRFAKGNVYAAYLGLAPGEHSSAAKVNRLGITKA